MNESFILNYLKILIFNRVCVCARMCVLVCVSVAVGV